MMTLTYQDTNEGKCKKCGRELEHLRGVSTGSTYCECRWCGYARLKATNAELLEALEAVADDDTYINYYVQEIVERAIRKAKGE